MLGLPVTLKSSHKKLTNLCVIIDNNNLQIDGSLEEVNSPYPIDEKFAAFGWNVINIDAHDFDAIRAAFANAKETKDLDAKEYGVSKVLVNVHTGARCERCWNRFEANLLNSLNICKRCEKAMEKVGF